MATSASRGQTVAMGFLFPIITAFTIFVRFYTRRRRKVALLADDWLCIPAWILTTGLCILIIYAVEANIFIQSNLPITETITKKQREFAQVSGAVPIFWVLGTTCVKYSILLFYRRIIAYRGFNSLSWFLIGLNAVWTFYAVLSWILYCGKHVKANFEGSWDVCPSWGSKLQIGVYVWESLIDLCLLFLPWPFIVGMQVIKQRRFEILFVFLLGSFAFIASLVNTIFQLAYLVNSDVFVSSPGSQDPDLTFFYWQTMELGVGLVVCNLPTLQPLYKVILQRLSGSPRRTHEEHNLYYFRSCADGNN